MKVVGRYISVLIFGVISILVIAAVLRKKYEDRELWTTNIICRISRCTMSRCFNSVQCLSQPDFKVYVYPTSNASGISILFSNILKVLRESSYYTDDYRSACLFVLGIDTTDRDRRSENFVKQVNDLVNQLPTEVWNDGRNHIIFNLYHGTYPDYSDHDLGFNIGYAMVARASANAKVFRRNFDLSFPLFHPKHPLRTVIEIYSFNTTALQNVWSLNLKDRHLVTFKGKRYVYGIGSETRDLLHHLHNGKTSIMVTTCKHNTDWKKYEDQRCEQDNIEFEKWDYEEIMSNSTFCLTPRGRRLGSFRFLESLRLGCIPVVLSDDWVLPFSEIIDWSQAAVIAHEQSVLTITDSLNAIPLSRIMYMRQQARGLYQRYFSSVERIVLTSVEIVKERLRKQKGMFGRQWNAEIFSVPPVNGYEVNGGCTVIVVTGNKVSTRLSRQLRLLSALPFVIKVRKLEPYHLTGAYAAVHKKIKGVWEVGFDTRTEHSMILTHLVLFRKDFIPLFWQWIPRSALTIAKKLPHCFTILLNFMLTERLYKPPTFIVGQKMELWISNYNYTTCFNELIKEVWMDGPLLIKSQTKIESVLAV
uniref:Exostosin-1 n=1 Tax=Syphacia muris TaxID=451379 RepID=A0A0N5AJQ8_9BILA